MLYDVKPPQIVERIECKKTDSGYYRIKQNYIAPTLTLINEPNIESGTSARVAENSNGGAFTSAF